MVDKIQTIDKDDLFKFLEENGFEPKSNNNNIHIQVRQKNFSMDIWPTTIRMNLHTKYRNEVRNLTLLTIYDIMKEIFNCSYMFDD